MKPWIKKLAQIGLEHPELRDEIREIVRAAAYDGNPDGKPIYDHEIDHGYSEPLGGGTDVMRRLQNQYRKEQGLDQRPASPQIPKQGAILPTSYLRNSFYSFSDGVISLTDAVRSNQATASDKKLQQLLKQANGNLDSINRHLNKTYDWD